MKQKSLVFCVILFICDEVSAGILDQTPSIVLFTSTNDEHKDMNKQFENMTRMMGFMTQRLESEDKNDLPSMVIASNFYFNSIIINLRTIINCSSLQLLKGTNFHTSDITECPSNKTETVFTDNVLKYERLYDAIVNKDFQVHDKVLVGLPSNLPKVHDVQAKLERLFPTLPLIFRDDNEMRNLTIDSSILAVVTPSAYQLETKTPTVIYSTPHVHPEDKDHLPNSINLLNSMKFVKHAILYFINSMHWYRVAILSDDHEDSAEFLDDLTPFLLDNGIVYTSQTCSKRDCNFFDAAVTLKTAAARIVILNLHPKNVDKIMPFINHEPVKYIVREWPFNKDQKINSDLFSFTLTPVFSEDFTQLWTNHDSPYIGGIKKSLEIINVMYKRAHGDKQLFAKNFKMRASRDEPYGAIVHIVRKQYNQDFRVVASMIIDGSNVNVVRFDKIYNQLPPDLTNHCIFRSRNFFKPCNDTLLPLLLGIIIIFILISIIIMVYFNKSRRNVYDRLF